MVGDAGLLPGDLATPLAVVLNELMQNAADHAFAAGRRSRRRATSAVRLARDDGELVVDVVDDGVGLPPGFTVEQSAGLGLSIVQALVTTRARRVDRALRATTGRACTSRSRCGKPVTEPTL